MTYKISMNNLSTFDSSKLSVKGPIKKTSKQATSMTYNIFELEYDYSQDSKTKIIKPFQLELIELNAIWGYSQVIDPTTELIVPDKFSISVKLDEENEEHNSLIKILDDIYEVFCKKIVSLKFKGNSNSDLFRNSCKPIYTVPFNENMERILDKSLSFKTVIEKWNKFYFPDMSVCELSNLEGLAFSYIPVFKFQIFSNSSMLVIQRKFQGGIITDIKEKGGSTCQVETCERLQSNDPSIAEKLREEILNLKGVPVTTSSSEIKEKKIEDINTALSAIKNKYPPRDVDIFASRSALLEDTD